jgi:low temperature requirement protein LtrA
MAAHERHEETAIESSFVWRRPPILRTDEGPDGERHATWLELFFDLVYVVAVAELAHLLHENLTVAGFLQFAFLFLPVWWAWTWFSYYADQFDTDDLPHRLATVAAMFGTIVLALTVHDAFHGGSAAFALAYAALRVLTIGLYVRAWRNVPEARELVTRFIAGFSIATALWLLSVFVAEPARFIMWGVALVISLATAPLSYVTTRHVPAQVSHMPERFGLFVIIVLGESIVAVAAGVADIEWQQIGVITAGAGFLMAVCMWWLYFERADPTVISQSVRGGRRELLVSHVYGWSHYLIYAGIGAAAVGLLAAIEASETGVLTFGGRLALCGGVVLFLLGAAANHWAAPRSIPHRVLAARLVVAALVTLLLFVGVLPAVVLVALVTLLLAGLVASELPRAAGAPKAVARKQGAS